MSVSTRSSNAWWIASLTVGIIVVGMAYSLIWPAVVRHTPHYWIYPFDLFGTVRASRWIGVGAYSFIYSGDSGIVTLPGFALLFTPVVMLSDALHLVSTSVTFPILRPSEWLLIGPASMATSAVALAGLDAIARSLDLSSNRRRVALIAEAVAIWPVIAWWGHPEDVLALGLSAFAFSRVVEDRALGAGWLLGLALAMQLYVLLIVPVFVGFVGVRRSLPLLTRAAFLPIALLLAVLIPNPHQTLHILLDQPTMPRVNHPTPWVLLARHLGGGEVAAGPGRLVGLTVASALGFVSARNRRAPRTIMWLAALAFGVRCLTEAVMTPYYVAPVIALVVLLAAFQSWRRWVCVVAASAALTALAFRRSDMWLYWFEMAATIGTMLAFSAPPSVGRWLGSGRWWLPPAPGQTLRDVVGRSTSG